MPSSKPNPHNPMSDFTIPPVDRLSPILDYGGCWDDTQTPSIDMELDSHYGDYVRYEDYAALLVALSDAYTILAAESKRADKAEKRVKAVEATCEEWADWSETITTV